MHHDVDVKHCMSVLFVVRALDRSLNLSVKQHLDELTSMKKARTQEARRFHWSFLFANITISY